MKKCDQRAVAHLNTARNCQKGPQAAQRAQQWGARFDRLLIHLDTDVLSYIQFPIAENVRRSNGLMLSELAQILEVLTKSPNWRALTITEVNPDHTPDESVIFGQLTDMPSSSLASH